jgi:polysaccharide pyruvyl transferase WcaK-like protein
MRDVLIYGSATHRNLGDLAMMQGLIQHLQNTHPNKRVVLVTRNPDFSQRILGIPCLISPDSDLLSTEGRAQRKSAVIGRGLLFLVRFLLWRFVSRRLAARVTPPNSTSFFAALTNAAALVVHGSGSFNSIFWRGWLYPKAFSAVCARLSRVPVLMTSQGIGPLRSRLDRLMARIFFYHAAYIGVRDGDFSREQARQAGAPADRVYHTGDDSALLPDAAPVEIDAALVAERIPDGPRLIGVNFRDASTYDPSHQERGYETLAAALDQIVQQQHAHVVFVPITYDHADDDRKSAERVLALMVEKVHTTIIRREYPATVVRGIIGRMHVVVGASYHFLLFALSQNVPALALTKNDYYLHKHRGLLTLYQQEEQRVDIADIGPAPLAVKFSELFDSGGDVRSILADRQPELAEESAGARKAFFDLVSA